MAIVPLDVTTQVRMRTVGVARLAAADTAVHIAVADQVRRYPPIQGAGLDLPARPAGGRECPPAELLRWESLHAVVETGGTYTAGKLLVKPPAEGSPATAEVALGVAVQEADILSWAG